MVIENAESLTGRDERIEEIRVNLWCDIFSRAVQRLNRDVAADVADSGLMEFDKRFRDSVSRKTEC